MVKSKDSTEVLKNLEEHVLLVPIPSEAYACTV